MSNRYLNRKERDHFFIDSILIQYVNSINHFLLGIYRLSKVRAVRIASDNRVSTLYLYQFVYFSKTLIRNCISLILKHFALEQWERGTRCFSGIGSWMSNRNWHNCQMFIRFPLLCSFPSAHPLRSYSVRSRTANSFETAASIQKQFCLPLYFMFCTTQCLARSQKVSQSRVHRRWTRILYILHSLLLDYEAPRGTT